MQSSIIVPNRLQEAGATMHFENCQQASFLARLKRIDHVLFLRNFSAGVNISCSVKKVESKQRTVDRAYFVPAVRFCMF
jgi:hypothetical protein